MKINSKLKKGRIAGIAVLLSSIMLASSGCVAVDFTRAYEQLENYIEENSEGTEEEAKEVFAYEQQTEPPVANGVYENSTPSVTPQITAAPGIEKLALDTDSTSLSYIFKKVENSVVSINTKQTGRSMYYGEIETESAGSGIVYSEDNENIYVATNYHVIEGANAATISFDDMTTVDAHYVGGYPDSDLAVIRVSKADLKAANISNVQIATFGNSDGIGVGDFAMAVGNALGEGKSATLGIISALGKTIETGNGKALNVLQTDAAINPGNSGGPLIDMNGRVIGINTAKYADYTAEGIGFAIPSNEAAKILNEILAAGGPELKPFLGIYSVEITEEIKGYYNLPSYGLYINATVDNCTAYGMGIKSGDIITKLNNHIIKNHTDLSNAMSTIKVGDSMTVTIVRTSRGVSQEQTLSGVMKGQSTDTTSF